VGVFAQEQNIGDASGFAGGGHAPLQFARRAIFHKPEINNQQLFHYL